MKIYDIRRSKDFFNSLSECKGAVKIISGDGRSIEFSGSRKELLNTELGCFDGTIPQIEVCFQETEDLHHILNFILNEKRTA